MDTHTDDDAQSANGSTYGEGCRRICRFCEEECSCWNYNNDHEVVCEDCQDNEDNEDDESLPDDADDHTTGYLMPDGRLVVIDEQLPIPEIDAAVGIVPAPIKVDAPAAQVTLSPTPKMTSLFSDAKPTPPLSFKFVVQRTLFVECEIDREGFMSLYQDAHDDPDVSAEDKRLLRLETEKVWQQLIRRKTALIIKDDPVYEEAEERWGDDWWDMIDNNLKFALDTTYKSLCRLTGRLGH